MDLVDRIRAFNRAYTTRLGLVGRSYLGSGLGLTDVRTIHDLDADGPVHARSLARTTGIDEAQLSRMLARFERQGWVARTVSAGDGRQRDVVLTEAGRALAAALRDKSRSEVGALLAGLSEGERRMVGEAVGTLERLLVGGGESALRDLAPGDAGWVIARHAALYAEDEGYDVSFEALVADILANFLRNQDPGRERGWIAVRGELRLGSIFCMRESDDVARLRLFFLERSERGTGLAQRMIEACLDFARKAGYRRMLLWTHESHRAAGRLYARNGFSLTTTAPGKAFGQDVVDQTWERDL